ncbi:ChpI protein [Deinococcus koreensis]|uniref:ChpI protein n=1 Tax=Deinococcus koreensis TaxID=2054903 RepID=A0A2K3UZB2_9DEIO|nr:ChpI protein [Deinococcus koreensis]PNY81888.1 ChpI protein [Deinococcus koreensis]
MKTAISLADSLYQRAERLARLRRLSRSELYAAALRDYLDRHEAADVTDQLNDLYAGEDSTLSPELRELGLEAVRTSQSDPP